MNIVTSKVLFLCLAFGINATGCQKASPLVGAWQTPFNFGHSSGMLRATFAADGTFNNTVKLTHFGSLDVAIVDTGTWKLDDQGKTLTTHTDDVQWNFSGDPSKVARATAIFQKSRSKILEGANKSPVDQLTWVGTDQFKTSDPSGETHTFVHIR